MAAGAVLLALAFRLWSPLRDLRVLLGLAVAGLAGHAALDVLTPWGVRLLWPADPRRIALGWVAEVDPVVWAILAGGLVLGLVWIGRAAACNRAALGCLAAYALAGSVSQTLAEAQFKLSLGTIRIRPARVAAYPAMLRPLEWNVVGWTADRYFAAEVQALSGMHGRLRSWFRVPVPAPVAGEFASQYAAWALAPLVKPQNAAGTSVALYDLAFLGRAEGMPYVVSLDAGPPGRPPAHAWQAANIAPPAPDEERELRNP